MGLNISGLIIENNFEKSIQQLSVNLEIGFKIIEESNIYDALERTRDKETVHIIFTEAATIILDEGRAYDEYIYSQTSNTLNFQYFETAMMFAFRYTRDFEVRRAVESLDNKILYSIGMKFKVEKETKNVNEVIIKLIEQKSNINIFNLDDQIKAIKCKLTKFEGVRKRMTKDEIHVMLTNRRISRNFNPDYDGLFS